MDTLKERLYALADPEYQKFHAKLCPGMKNNLGVRTPQLRTLAKELAKGDFREYLKQAKDDSYEEILLQGMVIGYAKMDLDERFSRISSFVPKIDNWATCDLFCNSLSFAKKFPDAVWDFVSTFLTAEQTYHVRFGVVMLLDYFITESYVDAVFSLLDSISHPDYYVKMAVAWAVSICYIRFPQKTLYFLQNNHLDDFTYQKSLQKIRESTRVSPMEKEVLKKMKR